MIIAGAGGHAREILDILPEMPADGTLSFFENVPGDKEHLNGFKILRNIDEVTSALRSDSKFVLGTGNPKLRHRLNNELTAAGGKLATVIAASSLISSFDTQLGAGCNVMAFAFISNNVTVGEGCLINARSNIHHDVIVGRYSEISPGATLLGSVRIGEFTVVGSNATILPKVKIGSHCIIGAGAVVTADIPDGSTAVGVPARIIKKTTL